MVIGGVFIRFNLARKFHCIRIIFDNIGHTARCTKSLFSSKRAFESETESGYTSVVLTNYPQRSLNATQFLPFSMDFLFPVCIIVFQFFWIILWSFPVLRFFCFRKHWKSRCRSFPMKVSLWSVSFLASPWMHLPYHQTVDISYIRVLFEWQSIVLYVSKIYRLIHLTPL